jgi:GNAT superfamily N-acetyltransferase
MTSPSFEIRPAISADVPLIHALVLGLAEYEREPQSAQLTAADLLRDGFGPAPAYSCLIAESVGAEGNKACGFALYFPIYSTWSGRSLYLEDLFVQPEYRGQGVGKALLARVAAIAFEQGCARLDWSVLRWNEPAIRFYESLGALPMVEWERMRLEGLALAAVASPALVADADAALAAIAGPPRPQTFEEEARTHVSFEAEA